MPKKHLTTQGEFWDTISLLYYGDEHYMHKLIEENYVYRNIVIFPAGIELIIPDLEIEKTNNNLPVWRRSNAG